MKNAWYTIQDIDAIKTPALVVFPDRVQENIDAMVAMAGSPDRLWPHIKTHKMKTVTRLLMDTGIQKFKCATLSEAKMLGELQVHEILWAIQPSGANLKAFLQLAIQYPESRWSTLVDNHKTLLEMEEVAEQFDYPLSVWLDLNVGMNRTGIDPDNEEAWMLYHRALESPNLTLRGLHAYDGHIRAATFEEREDQCNQSFEKVSRLALKIKEKTGATPSIITSGSPSFPHHIKRSGVFLSPGTIPFWDAGYSKLWPTSPFQPAAILVSRIISQPAKDLLCFDLGHKTVAAEMPFPRVVFPQLPEEATQISQSEEHLVVQTQQAHLYEVGDIFYAIPMHICPTVAKYTQAYTVENRLLSTPWTVDANIY